MQLGGSYGPVSGSSEDSLSVIPFGIFGRCSPSLFFDPTHSLIGGTPEQKWNIAKASFENQQPFYLGNGTEELGLGCDPGPTPSLSTYNGYQFYSDTNMTCCQPGNQEQQPDLSEPPPTPALSIGYEADIRLPSSPSTLPTSATPGDIKGPSLNKRDKNRAAAARCRDKARKSRSELEELERELFLKNQMLQTETKALQEEVLQLKHDILSHASCDSAAIQRYIEYTAENYGKGS